MALDVCVAIPASGDPMSLSLPGGLSITDLNLMKQIQPLLAPLMPLFEIIDVVVALYRCMNAIPKCLGPPPDPTELVKALPALAEKIMKVMELIPQMSLPVTIANLVDLVIAALREVKTKHQGLQDQLIQIEHSVAIAEKLNDPSLTAIITCAQGNVQQEAANVGSGLAALGKLLGIIALFMKMIGGPKIPDLSSIDSAPLADVIKPIDELVTVLTDIRKNIPFPVSGANCTQVL